MAMSNSCVNPPIYGVMSSKFRAGYLHYWHCLITCCRSSNNRCRNKEDRMENTSTVTTFQLNNKTHELNVKTYDMDCDPASITSVPCSMPLISSQRVSSND